MHLCLRHKTSKSSFVAAFWFTVLLNFAGLYVIRCPWHRATTYDVKRPVSRHHAAIHRVWT